MKLFWVELLAKCYLNFLSFLYNCCAKDILQVLKILTVQRQFLKAIHKKPFDTFRYILKIKVVFPQF